jgi:hypothetical protein
MPVTRGQAKVQERHISPGTLSPQRRKGRRARAEAETEDTTCSAVTQKPGQEYFAICLDNAAQAIQFPFVLCVFAVKNIL